MTKQELLNSLLQNLTRNLEKIEKNNLRESQDLLFCKEQNIEIKSKINLKRRTNRKLR